CSKRDQGRGPVAAARYRIRIGRGACDFHRECHWVWRTVAGPAVLAALESSGIERSHHGCGKWLCVGAWLTDCRNRLHDSSSESWAPKAAPTCGTHVPGGGAVHSINTGH